MIINEFINPIKNLHFNTEAFAPEILDWIAKENLYSLWVPKEYGGLEVSFCKGLEVLRSLARVNGSLGWMVTLCAGANYFIGNLKTEVANEIFNQKSPAILGGSGGRCGTAKKEGSTYCISGQWPYATGAPYLTHFTFNAAIVANGKKLKNEDGSTLFRSFIVPAHKVEITQNWRAMGLKATSTHSFKIDELLIEEKYSFIYDQFHLPQPIFNIPFTLFADLTLCVNYIGMAEHFLKEASTEVSIKRTSDLKAKLANANDLIRKFAIEIETTTSTDESLKAGYVETVHKQASHLVRSISKAIVELYPHLGIKACSEGTELNSVFKDYFTATQHRNFVM